MKLKKKLIYSAIISIAYTLASTFSNLVPCRVAPNVPSPLYKWSLCALTPDSAIKLNSIKEFWGYTIDPLTAYLITASIGFLVPFLIIYYINKKTKKGGK